MVDHDAGVFYHANAKRGQKHARFGRAYALLHPESSRSPRQGQHFACVIRAVLRGAKKIYDIHRFWQGRKIGVGCKPPYRLAYRMYGINFVAFIHKVAADSVNGLAGLVFGADNGYAPRPFKLGAQFFMILHMVPER